MNEWMNERMNEWMNFWQRKSRLRRNLQDEATFFTSFQIQNSLVIRIFAVDAVSDSPLNKSRTYLPLLWRWQGTPQRQNCVVPHPHPTARQSWIWATIRKSSVGISSCVRFPNFSLQVPRVKSRHSVTKHAKTAAIPNNPTSPPSLFGNGSPVSSRPTMPQLL